MTNDIKGMTPKTSRSHPLQIATVDIGRGMGRIGITFCPGKIQDSAC
jgi:ADP-ribosyl-[dinitrogen reductase] hydrolase